MKGTRSRLKYNKDPTKRNVPELAHIRLFPGAIPDVLLNLNPVEKSMVSIINCICYI